jgi:hypothetical protein
MTPAPPGAAITTTPPGAAMTLTPPGAAITPTPGAVMDFAAVQAISGGDDMDGDVTDASD